MPAPLSYSDATLAAFMVTELGGIAGVLSWTAGSDAVTEAASDTAGILGLAVADVTNMASLRAVARLSIWRLAEAALAVMYDITTDGQSLKRSQIPIQAKRMVERYEDQCVNLSITGVRDSGVMFIDPVERSEDYLALPAAAVAEF